MRSDTHKHLEDCTLLRVNAQTARGTGLIDIGLDRGGRRRLGAIHLYLYVFPEHPEGSVAKGIARRYVSIARKSRIDLD